MPKDNSAPLMPGKQSSLCAAESMPVYLRVTNLLVHEKSYKTKVLIFGTAGEATPNDLRAKTWSHSYRDCDGWEATACVA